MKLPIILSLNKTLLLAASVFTLATGCKAQEESSTQKYSPPFIIIDLKKDGINLIPLEESEANFDLDGDGSAEHISWIETGDAFLLTYTMREDVKFKSKTQRERAYATGGFAEILKSDMDGDSDYDSDDIAFIEESGAGEVLRAGIVIDYDQNGTFSEAVSTREICQSPMTIRKTAEKPNIKNPLILAHGRLVCQNNEYPLYEVRYAYEDSLE